MKTIPFTAPLVVGYKGEIGSFILNGLLRVMPKALNIFCFDINETEKEKQERIQKADYIFLCVPMDKTIPWLVKYKKVLTGKVIVEQCSLKKEICCAPKLQDLKVLSMHLLFRPSGTPQLSDRRCGLFTGQGPSGFVDVVQQMTQAEIIFFKNWKQHDRVMAVQQALVHRTLLVLGKALEKTGMKGTYVSGKVMELAARIRQGDKKMYTLIQNNTCVLKEVHKLCCGIKDFKIQKYMKKK
jgi:prephenate dehydrogenase